MKKDNFKVYKMLISIFWILILILLFCLITAGENRGIIELLRKESWLFIPISIIIFGIITVLFEKILKNITITYFLFFYFLTPVWYGMVLSYSALTNRLIIEDLHKMIYYCVFLTFTIVSISGFISWIKRKYKTVKVYLILCVFFYLFVFIITILWADK